MAEALINRPYDNRLRLLLLTTAISPQAVSKFVAVINTITSAVDVSFTLTDITGMASVTLSRNYTLDPATATVLQTWAPLLAGYTWADTDTALATQGEAFYWLTFAPQGVGGSTVTAGPQSIVLNPQLLAPIIPAAISASSGAVTNGGVGGPFAGTVKIAVNVGRVAATVEIYVTGYRGNPAMVAVASSASSHMQFLLNATGETVTLTAIGMSAGGVDTTTGPITTLALDGVATIPARIQNVIITQIKAGNQVNWPVSLDGGPTYKVYRGLPGRTFGEAVLLATAYGTAATLNYLDRGGRSGTWVYYITTTNGVGESLPSPAAQAAVVIP